MSRLLNPANCIKQSKTSFMYPIFIVRNKLKNYKSNQVIICHLNSLSAYQQILSHPTTVYVQITSSLLEIIYCSCHKCFNTIFILHLIIFQSNSYFYTVSYKILNCCRLPKFYKKYIMVIHIIKLVVLWFLMEQRSTCRFFIMYCSVIRLLAKGEKPAEPRLI